MSRAPLLLDDRAVGREDRQERRERLRQPHDDRAALERRVAAGAGVQVQEVNRLLNQFEQTQKVMKQFAKGGMAKMMRGMKGMLPGKR